MKTLLTFCLILIGMIGMAQNSYTIVVSEDSSYHISSYICCDTISYRPIHYDTVEVVLLICDTSRKYSLHESVKYDSLTGYYEIITIDTSWFKPSHQVWWRFGLEVLRKTYLMEDEVSSQHIKYLDEIGNEFPKGVMVWQSIKR